MAGCALWRGKTRSAEIVYKCRARINIRGGGTCNASAGGVRASPCGKMTRSANVSRKELWLVREKENWKQKSASRPAQESWPGARTLKTRLLLALACGRADRRGACEMEWSGATGSGNSSPLGKRPHRNRRPGSGAQFEDLSRSE